MSPHWYVWIAAIAVVCLMIFFALRRWSRNESIAASLRGAAPNEPNEPSGTSATQASSPISPSTPPDKV